MSPVWSALRDAFDIARRARSVRELVRLVPRWRVAYVLNEGGDHTAARRGKSSAAQTPAQAVHALRGLRNRIKGDALTDDGRIDYARLRASAAAGELDRASGALRDLDPTLIEDDHERLAFWINLYNVLTIHGVIVLEIRESVMEVPSFFSAVAYRVGPDTFTPDDIENGVLRRNGPHPATRRPLFAADDPRLACCPSYVDPRIHAALVCGAASCPPVGFYDVERIDDQLRAAAQHYVAHNVTVDDAARTIEYPIAFRYYADDFGDLRAFVLEHAGDEQRAAINAAYDGDYRVVYARYDWSLNAVI